MTTRHGTNHFGTWASAFKYYANLNYARKDVVKMVSEGIINIGEPTISTEQRLYLDDDGRYYIEFVDGSILSPSLLLDDTARAYGKSSETIIDSHEQPQWFKDYMKEHGHEFTKGWKEQTDVTNDS
jgi:hypothetical protein